MLDENRCNNGLSGLNWAASWAGGLQISWGLGLMIYSIASLCKGEDFDEVAHLAFTSGLTIVSGTIFSVLGFCVNMNNEANPSSEYVPLTEVAVNETPRSPKM